MNDYVKRLYNSTLNDKWYKILEDLKQKKENNEEFDIKDFILRIFSQCSFCIDSICRSCKIDKSICGEESHGGYIDVFRKLETVEDLIEGIEEMIKLLEEARDKL